jgi:hypothetical protein
MSDMDDTDRKMIHVHKDILACQELNAISLLDSQIRSYIRRNTYPTDFGNGVYIMPLAILDEVDQRLISFQEERERLIDAFCLVYEDRKKDAKARLGRFYNENDYPPIDSVASRFSFKVQCLAFEVPENLAKVRKEIFDREKAKAEESWSKTFAMVQDALKTGLKDVVSHMVERLTPDANGNKKRFKDATVLNLLDFLGSFEKRNIVNDKALNELVEQAKFALKDVNVNSIREDDDVRQSVLTSFNEIKNKLSNMTENIHIRMIDFED